MSREPAAEQIEAVAEALYEHTRKWGGIGEWPMGLLWGDLDEDGEARNSCVKAARAAIAAMNAEPLTSTPEPSTTETGPGGAVNPDPPPGFSWEYRAVNVAPDGVEQEWSWGTLEDARSVWSDYSDDPEDVWVERRLVGPAERIEE